MKRTLLIGPAASGKSYTASMIRKTYQSVLALDGYQIKTYNKIDVYKWFEKIMLTASSYPELLIVDDIPATHLKAVIDLFYNTEFSVEKRGVGPVIFSPDVILVCECDQTKLPTDISFKVRYNVIECLSCDNKGVYLKISNHFPIA